MFHATAPRPAPPPLILIGEASSAWGASLAGDWVLLPCADVAAAGALAGAGPAAALLIGADAATLRRLRAAAPEVAAVVLLEAYDAAAAEAVLEAGAQECLESAGLGVAELRRALRHALARKRAEAELRLSEARLKGLVEIAQDAILTADAQLNIQLFNPAAERLFGYAADDIAGQPLSLLLPQRFRAGHAGNIAGFGQAAGQTRAPHGRGEVTGVTRDGREFPAEVTIGKVHHPLGALYTAAVRDITERRRAEEELRNLATTDPLTGVWNRRQFFELAEAELGRHARNGLPACLMLLDIDHFKAINDSHGHAAGDRALVAFATACKDELRASDLLARIGGEEFALFLPETDIATAQPVADRLRRRIAATRVPLRAGSFGMTVSLGLTTVQPTDGGIDLAMSRADQALYTAKAVGRDRVVVG